MRSTRYSDLTKLAVLFPDPYVQTGTRERVVLEYSLEDNFNGDGRRWDYDVSVDTLQIDFRLIVPASFRAKVRLARHMKPTDQELQVLQPSDLQGRRVYSGSVQRPEVGGTYSLIWC